jgi:hypothetical protein
MTIIATNPERTSFSETFKLVLPKEHGSWSLALEPLALGILAAPSAAGGSLAVAAAAGFLMRRPLKLLLSGKSDPRFGRALAVTTLLSLLAVSGLVAALAMGGLNNLWLLAPAAIAGLGFVWFDSRNEGRQEAAELCGVLAFGILPAAFAKLAGWSLIASLALAAVMLVRSVSTVLLVRTFLRRKKGYAASPATALIASVLGFCLIACLVFSHLAPWPAMVFAFLLAAGAFWVLGGNRRFTARQIGIAEMCFGLLMILTLAATWRLH